MYFVQTLCTSWFLFNPPTPNPRDTFFSLILYISEMRKTYENDKVKVLWQPDVCIHAAECVKGLPGVFNQHAKPWINIDGASAEEIKAQVAKCPSKALSIIDDETPKNEETMSTKIDMAQNGPILVHGNCTITNSDGSVEQKEGVTALCRCGASKNKPYCDGAHNSNGFEG